MHRKKRGPASRNVATQVPHGKSRTAAEVIQLVDATEEGLLMRMSRESLSRALMKVAKVDEPLPLRTVDDYIKRVHQRWEEEAIISRPKLKARQGRRLYVALRALVGRRDLRGAVEYEKLIAKIEGNLAPVKVEASTPPGQPIEVKIRDPRKMTSGERRSRIAHLTAKRIAVIGGAAAAAVAAADDGEPAAKDASDES